MSDPSAALRLQLERLRDSYLAHLHEAVAGIEITWGEICAGPWDVARALALERLTHNVAGSAGVFGFSTVTRCAHDLELCLEALRQRGPDHHPHYCRQVTALLRALRRSLDDPGGSRPSAGILTPDEPAGGQDDREAHSG
ncbi:MAG: Hpt domain-containing protein [Armatimonadetes bacterium]|nr:Hpt domain-containing protein [Armatimonadota bacterium]